MRRRDEDKRKYYDDAHSRFVTDYVTLAKRNDGDYMGVPRSGNSNAWLPILNKGFFTYPVVPRSIRSKTATAVSTDIQLDISSAIKTPEKKAGAELAQNLYRYEEERHWTERVETMIAMLGQIGRFCAILTEKDGEEGLTVGYEEKTKNGWLQTQDDLIGCVSCGATYSPEQLGFEPPEYDAEGKVISSQNGNIPKREKDGIAGGSKESFEHSSWDGDAPRIDAHEKENIAVAPNGATYDNPDEMLADYPPRPQPREYDLQSKKCLNPECESTNLGINQSAQYEPGLMPTGEKDPIKAAQINQKVISSLLIRFDDIHTIGFDWQKSHWFNYHPLESLYEILADCPELEDKIRGGDWSEWSDSARWFYELTKQNGNLGAPASSQQSALDELVEANYWFYQPIMCHGWTEPDGSGYELIKNGETVFSIQPGETIEAATKRSFNTDDFRGVMVKMVGKEIVDVKNVSFLDLFTLVGWMLSVTSHAPTGEERLIQLQDAATRVFSMVYSCVQRLAVPKGWADGRVWNREDLLNQTPGAWIMSKQDINPDDLRNGIAGSVGYITPPNPSNLIDVFINLIIQIAKEESGIFDETVGSNNSQNQTAAGRATALNQSLNLMTPTQKAKKEGKIAWTRVILKLWQTMPDEAFVLIKGTYEEEWKAADIAAFKAMDIDRELVIKAVEGTDVPKTRPQQLVNFQIAAGMGLLAPNPAIDPELQQYILKNVLGIDFDMNNLEADRRLAARRLEAMHEITDGMAKQAGLGYDQLIDVATDPATGAPTRKLHADILMTYAQDLRTKVRQEDNHAAFAGFYIDQLKGVTGGREPREVDVLILENALDMHNQMIAEKARTEALANTMANAPSMPPPIDGAPQTKQSAQQ